MKAIDVMGFAGSMAAGVDQAGFDVIAKREPTKFDRFGVDSVLYNMPWVESQVAAPEAWELPSEPVELAYGCPPCSGFSALSIINNAVHGASANAAGKVLYGADADINECMGWFVGYAARVKPPMVVMESVGPAFKVGREWMESLFYKLREESGLDYHLTHVNMDAGLVGGDVVRRRYFFVAHLQPFGVGLDFVSPRPLIDVIGDLPGDADVSPGDAPASDTDTDWGHVCARGEGVRRNFNTVKFLRSIGLDWRQGTRMPDNLPGEWLEDPTTMPPEMQAMWKKPRPSRATRWANSDGMAEWYSHLRSTDAFSPVMWKDSNPFGVVVAATLFRGLRGVGRNFTYREAARFMSLPDTWSLRVLVEGDKAAELGKAVPTASAKWIAHWARMSVEGTPGEYAGRDTADPLIRVITVNSKNAVAEVGRDEGDAFWPESMTSDPDPRLWLVDRKARPREWWQREDELGIFAGQKQGGNAREAKEPDSPIGVVNRGPAPQPVKAATRPTKSVAPAPKAGAIVRIQPGVMQVLLDSLGLSKAQAAEKLGVSVSRVNELVTDKRPGSWLNAERFQEVQDLLRA